jgi:hypothetical protein
VFCGLPNIVHMLKSLVVLQRSGTYWRCLLVLTDQLLRLCRQLCRQLYVGMACQLSSCGQERIGGGHGLAAHILVDQHVI